MTTPPLISMAVLIYTLIFWKRHFLPRDTTVCRIFLLLFPHKRNGRGAVMQSQADITALLDGWREGDRAALDRLHPLIRTELERLARRHLAREGKNHTMQPSSLVQEAFLRLLPGVDAGWQNRAHFFGVASQVMRHVLVDYARKRRREKRGCAAVHIPLDAAVVLSSEQVDEIVAVDLALQRLAKIDARKSRVLEMRFFGGLSVEEVAEVLGVAANTVIRDWSFARAWLRRELSGDGTTERGTLAAN
jgi:RNA polymerase sigma-70 factor (ECF subfamily)